MAMHPDPDDQNRQPPLRMTSDPGVNVLFLATFPLIVWVFRGTFVSVIMALVVLWCLTLAIRLIQQGQLSHRVYTASKVAKAPRLPLKLLGSLLLGMTVSLIAALQFESIPAVAGFGALATGMSIAAFGLDPFRDKGQTDPQHNPSLAAARFVEDTDQALTALSDGIAVQEDAELTRRMDGARLLVLRLLRGLHEDPAAVLRLERSVTRFVEMLRTEVDRMNNDRDPSRENFARLRFIAKLEVICDSFERHVVGAQGEDEADHFALEADLLLGRMPARNAA